MKDNERVTLLTVLLAAFAVFRLSGYIAYDNGPGGVFEKVRDYVKRKKRLEESIGLTDSLDIIESEPGMWANLDEGINCPYCVGTWMAMIITGMVFLLPRVFTAPVLFLFGIAGGQNVIERLIKGVEKISEIKEY